MIEPFKYLIQPVAIERDDETGRIIREHPGQTLAVYSAEDAVRAVMEFEAAIQQLTTTEGEHDEPDQQGHSLDGRVATDPSVGPPAGGVRLP